MKVLLIAGARPNFMKIAPVYRESIKRNQVDCLIVHTGQHYDYQMSEAFFDDLELPQPSYFLNAGSGSHAVQTANIMIEFEKVCLAEKPDLVMVVGDVNSTLATGIVAKKMLIELAHIEAGLRSFDMTMPEEINRMVTDSISDYYFVTEESGVDNLKNEGQKDSKIFFVGNVMIDNLFYQVNRLKSLPVNQISTMEMKPGNEEYVFLTLHRPSNVDNKLNLKGILEAVKIISKERPVLFPAHPRTRKMMEKFDIKLPDSIRLLPPLDFSDALYLWKDAAVVLTDSGGLQEETTALGVPCVTIRENTERPITITMGTNILAGVDKDSILKSYSESLANKTLKRPIPPLWDGQASHRIWDILTSIGK